MSSPQESNTYPTHIQHMVEEQHQFFNLVHVVFFKRTLVWWPTDFLKIGGKDEGKR